MIALAKMKDSNRFKIPFKEQWKSLRSEENGLRFWN